MNYPAKILAALHEVMTKVGYVQKRDRNDFHRYNYAGEGALLETLRPAMVEAGLLLIPSHKHHSEIDEYGNLTVLVEYTLAHKDGDVWPDKIVAAGAGNDKNKAGVGDKGLYKALTGANKYLLFKLFQIETGDDPEQSETPAEKPAKKPTKAQVKQVTKQHSTTPPKPQIWLDDMTEAVNHTVTMEGLQDVVDEIYKDQTKIDWLQAHMPEKWEDLVSLQSDAWARVGGTSTTDAG